MPDSKCSENVEGCLTAEDCATGTPNKSKSASLQYEHSRIYCYVLRLNVFDRDLHSNQNILHKKHVRSWLQPPLTVHTVTVFVTVSVYVFVSVFVFAHVFLSVYLFVSVFVSVVSQETRQVLSATGWLLVRTAQCVHWAVYLPRNRTK